MLKFLLSITAFFLFGLLSVVTCFNSANAASGNFDLEAAVHVVWDLDGNNLVSNGARDVTSELTEELGQPVYIEQNKGTISLDGKKYYKRNLTSGDAVLLVGVTNANLASPMRDSEYLGKNYVTSLFGFLKIYVAPQEPGWNSSQLSYIIPSGTKYFLVNYHDVIAHSFTIRVYGLLDGLFEVDPEPINPNVKKDGLTFDLEEIAKLNAEAEEQEQLDALSELDENNTIRDENLVIEDDQMMLIACAAEHDACELDANPEAIRQFMKLDTKQEAEAKLKEEIAERAD